MNIERLELLKAYIETGISPLLLENMTTDSFQNAVVLKSTVGIEELNGHYEKDQFCPPAWYYELLEKGKHEYVLLVIDKINEISLTEQTKFIELLKYKKISTFNLPSNCFIIVTCTNLSEKKINEEVYSLLVQI